MDFTRFYYISSECKDKHIKMEGAGGSFGGRITIAKVRCPNCDLCLMIVPISKEYEYGMTATTEEERKENRIEEARKASELELARTITRIKETGY